MWCRDDRWWFGPLAGAMGSTALVFETPHRVSELMLYCLPKALYIVFLVRMGRAGGCGTPPWRTQ